MKNDIKVMRMFDPFSSRHISAKGYRESYKQDTIFFEPWIHKIIEPQIIRFFVQTYEEKMNRDNNREVFDYAKILLGSYTRKGIDTSKGKQIMIMLAEKKGERKALEFLFKNERNGSKEKKHRGTLLGKKEEKKKSGRCLVGNKENKNQKRKLK